MKIDLGTWIKNAALAGLLLIMGYNHTLVAQLLANQAATACKCPDPSPAPAPAPPPLPPVAVAAKAHVASFAAPWHAAYAGATATPPTITTKTQLYQALGSNAATLNAEINKIAAAACDADGNIVNPAALADLETTYKALGGK